MDIGEYFGIKYHGKHNFDQIFTSHNNLDFAKFTISGTFINILSHRKTFIIIKFINMFKDVNCFEHINSRHNRLTLCGTIMSAIRSMKHKNTIGIYTIMDHLFKLNMDVAKIAASYHSTYGVYYYLTTQYANTQNYKIVKYIIKNYTIIKNTRNLINNYDILLFKINDAIHLIKLFLLIGKCKQKNLPKFIIIHKILYYYLLHQNCKHNKQ